MTRGLQLRRFTVEGGELVLRPDPDAPHAWVVEIDGTRQSHVDCDDPGRLVFDYVRRIGHVVDLAAAPGAPLRAVHLGGGGLTLPRYVAATRPGSRQRVFETDAELTAVVRRELPLERSASIRVRTIDALEGLRAAGTATADLVVMDVFDEGRTPAHLASDDVIAEAHRVLSADGVYAANLLDAAIARRHIAALLQLRPTVAAILPAARRSSGKPNTVVLAAPEGFDLDALRTRCAADPSPGRLVGPRPT